MKKLLLCFLLLVTLFSFAQQTKKVLFLGNSYTYGNNLPNLIQQMATSTNDILIQDSNAIGGFRFMDHVTNQTSLTKLNANQWDYVVLQEQSQMPAFPLGYVNQNVFPYANQLVNLAKQNYTCEVPLFFTTWGRKNGDPQICLNGQCTYTVMDDLLQQRYRAMADTNKGVVSPVAQVWRYIRANHPTIELYTSDESHPSLAGSMAAAYAFYVAIFKKDPTLVSFNSTLDATTANILKNAAKTVVFNNKDYYYIDINDNFASFTASMISGTNVQFQNTTLKASNIQWNFGDGSTSTQQNPSHQFQTNGSYTVTLTLTVCGKIYTKTLQIVVSQLSTDEILGKEIQLFPNPTKNVLSITNLEYSNVTILDLSGKKINAPKTINYEYLQFDVSHLANGSYFIQVSKNNATQSYQFIKN